MPTLHILKLFHESFSNPVYVLHTFKKKSPQGVKTPQKTIDLIYQRLQAAKQISEVRQKTL